MLAVDLDGASVARSSGAGGSGTAPPKCACCMLLENESDTGTTLLSGIKSDSWSAAMDGHNAVDRRNWICFWNVPSGVIAFHQARTAGMAGADNPTSGRPTEEAVWGFIGAMRRRIIFCSQFDLFWDHTLFDRLYDCARGTMRRLDRCVPSCKHTRVSGVKRSVTEAVA